MPPLRSARSRRLERGRDAPRHPAKARMTSASPGATSAPLAADPDTAPSGWRRLPAAPLGLSLLLLGFSLFPRVQANPRLLLSFDVAAAFLVAWSLLLWIGPARRRGFAVEFARPQKSHYIQASVQILIYVYWGWYWREVYSAVPLFLAQFT